LGISAAIIAINTNATVPYSGVVMNVIRKARLITIYGMVSGIDTNHAMNPDPGRFKI
jgi:hypothetical protein